MKLVVFVHLRMKFVLFVHLRLEFVICTSTLGVCFICTFTHEVSCICTSTHEVCFICTSTLGVCFYLYIYAWSLFYENLCLIQTMMLGGCSLPIVREIFYTHCLSPFYRGERGVGELTVREGGFFSLDKISFCVKILKLTHNPFLEWFVEMMSKKILF